MCVYIMASAAEMRVDNGVKINYDNVSKKYTFTHTHTHKSVYVCIYIRLCVYQHWAASYANKCEQITKHVSVSLTHPHTHTPTASARLPCNLSPLHATHKAVLACQ